MKKVFVWLMVVLMLLSLSSMACDAIGGGDDSDADSGDTTDTDSGDTDTDSGDSGSSDADMVRGLPVTGDASEVVDAETAGIIAVTYKTDMSVDEAADFYRTEMEALGYSNTADTEAGGTAALMYNGDLGNVSIAIATDPLGSGKTVVSIGTTP
jgi:hypothetical protein